MIGILDYGFGNLHSVSKALDFLEYENKIIKSKDDVKYMDKLILPGVGAFEDAIFKLKKEGFHNAIYDFVKDKREILGICLGMQLLFEKSYENGEHTGLGILQGHIVKIKGNVKIPHMGWNLVENNNSTLYKNINNPYFYFVHSYHLETEENIVTGKTNYGHKFAVSVEKENVMGVQFHPEKSGETGLELLKNFC